MLCVLAGYSCAHCAVICTQCACTKKDVHCVGVLHRVHVLCVHRGEGVCFMYMPVCTYVCQGGGCVSVSMLHCECVCACGEGGELMHMETPGTWLSVPKLDSFPDPVLFSA